MRKVLRAGKDVKARRARVKESMKLNRDTLETDLKLQLIQELIPLGLLHGGELLTEEALRPATPSSPSCPSSARGPISWTPGGTATRSSGGWPLPSWISRPDSTESGDTGTSLS
jgi:hypothetical protein